MTSSARSKTMARLRHTLVRHLARLFFSKYTFLQHESCTLHRHLQALPMPVPMAAVCKRAEHKYNDYA